MKCHKQIVLMTHIDEGEILDLYKQRTNIMYVIGVFIFILT